MLTGFQKALKAMPSFIGGYDPMRHKTTSDLVYIVRTEMDMFEEGEPEADIKNRRQYEAAKRFIAKVEGFPCA
jgi:hypothetical protein